MNFAVMENAARETWPAIEAQQMPYGTLRFANGYTRRANSLALSNPSLAEYHSLLVDSENFFADRLQPAMIRLPCLPQMSKIDRFLEFNGYASEAPSMVMVRHLNIGQEVLLQPRRLDIESWLGNFYTISGRPVAERPNHRQLISQIEGDTFYAVLDSGQGTPACCALAIHCNGFIGIYNVATAPCFRRQQYASHLIAALLFWGRDIGATYAFLQVEECNPPAVKLYRKLGFEEFYRYRYRVKRTAAEVGREEST